jgi:hypothetical protein
MFCLILHLHQLCLQPSIYVHVQRQHVCATIGNYFKCKKQLGFAWLDNLQSLLEKFYLFFVIFFVKDENNFTIMATTFCYIIDCLHLKFQRELYVIWKYVILVMWCLGLDMLVSKKSQVNNFMNNILGIKWGSIKHVITFGTCFKCASFFFSLEFRHIVG